MTTEKTTEPLWWGLFSAGGVVAAFLVPIHIVLVGFALPLGWISDSGALYRIWWVKLYLFILDRSSLPFTIGATATTLRSTTWDSNP